ALVGGQGHRTGLPGNVDQPSVSPFNRRNMSEDLPGIPAILVATSLEIGGGYRPDGARHLGSTGAQARQELCPRRDRGVRSHQRQSTSAISTSCYRVAVFSPSLRSRATARLASSKLTPRFQYPLKATLSTLASEGCSTTIIVRDRKSVV